MTRYHFAGLNTAMFAEILEGESVLISYADIVRRPGVWEREILPRLVAGLYETAILDSGAFTELTTPGFSVSIDDYVRFCRGFGHLFDQVITLDDIGGNLARTWTNTAALAATGVPIVPVFHGREPFEVLAHYCDRFPQIGLGFARDRGRISKDQGQGMTPDAWLERALDICEAAGVDVHGFGMTRYATDRGHDRLTTTDSTTWIAEYRALMIRNATGDHALGEDAAILLGPVPEYELAALAVRSLQGTGPDFEVGTVLEGTKGQARTCLSRFKASELCQALDDIAERFAVEIDPQSWPTLTLATGQAY